MTRDKARAILEAHNKWRRGGDAATESPSELGCAIDVAVAELAKPAAVPDTCRQKLMKEGKPYPRSSCNFCGLFSPRRRECDAMLAAAPQPPAPDKPVTVVVTGSDHIVDANKLVTADFEWLRVVAVEAIRNLTGCPDVVGKDGACLTDELMRVAKLARLADFINSPPAPAVSPVDIEAARDDLERLIQHAAEVMSAVRRDDIDFANDSFRSLPDHLSQEIDTRAEAISDEQYQLARAIGDKTDD